MLTIPDCAVQRNARRPEEEFASPTATRPFPLTACPNDCGPPGNTPRLIMPVAGVQYKARAFVPGVVWLHPTTAGPDDDTPLPYAALPPGKVPTLVKVGAAINVLESAHNDNKTTFERLISGPFRNRTRVYLNLRTMPPKPDTPLHIHCGLFATSSRHAANSSIRPSRSSSIPVLFT